MNKNLWEREYLQKGIPSSFKTVPSGAVGKFLYPYIKNYKQGLVLDIGCGLGRNSMFMAKQGFNVIAMDFVQDNIDSIAKDSMQNHLPINAICADINHKWHVPDSTIDIAMDNFCYKHQIDVGIRKFYRQELYRVLKDDGIYLISLASKDDGFYGSLLQDNDNNIVIDPFTGIQSVLFSKDEFQEEFADYFEIIDEQIENKSDIMHGSYYMRTTMAFIVRKKTSKS
jgi:SAM-dependent methyltransferase